MKEIGNRTSAMAVELHTAMREKSSILVIGKLEIRMVTENTIDITANFITAILITLENGKKINVMSMASHIILAIILITSENGKKINAMVMASNITLMIRLSTSEAGWAVDFMAMVSSILLMGRLSISENGQMATSTLITSNTRNISPDTIPRKG
jgi:hypothetical protein